MPSKHIRSWYPTVVQGSGGGGGSTSPNIVWTDPVKYRDAQVVNPKIAEALKVRDAQALVNPKVGETMRYASVRKNPAVTVVAADTMHYPERGIGKVTELIVARSGGPDADIAGDAWTDGIPLNNGVNHGNESPLPTSGNLLSATSQFPWFEWNLTTPKFVGLAHRAAIGTAQFSFFASQGLAVAQTLNVVLWASATKPFTESTLTFTNQPAVPGSGTVTRVFSVLVGAANGRYDINLTAAEFAPFIGNWMVIRMDSAAVAATPINIVSREGAAAERPRLTFDFQIGT